LTTFHFFCDVTDDVMVKENHDYEKIFGIGRGPRVCIQRAVLRIMEEAR
jgi:hypothetical protein